MTQCALGYQTPSKTPLLLSCQAHFKSSNCPSPLLGSPLYISFLETPPLKLGFFSERPKYQCFSFLTLSYLLKVTKSIVKICQFEFLVMTEKNVFVHKNFLSLNISDSLFVVKLQPPWKNYPPLKVEVLPSPPF